MSPLKVDRIPATEQPLNWRSDLPPFMGFEEEQYVPGVTIKGGVSWTYFYTCIANGKRVYVWAYRMGSSSDQNGTCVMVSDNLYDPGRGASIEELQHMFADQHDRQKARNITRTHRVAADEMLLLQAFIYEVTRGGNENMEIVKQ
jgi:hypothetical protein